jgi:DNA-binding response OmpR family regulator
MRKGLAGIFRRAGYEVEEARDFDEALVVLEKGNVGALIVSFRLPPDGCRALLDACQSPPPTVVLNGYAEDVAAIAAYPTVRSVLTRPFPLQTLYDAVAGAAG